MPNSVRLDVRLKTARMQTCKERSDRDSRGSGANLICGELLNLGLETPKPTNVELYIGMILVYNLFFHTNTHTHAHAYAHVHEQHYNTAEEARNAEASFNLGLMHYYGGDIAKPFILKRRKHKITISKCSCSGRVAEESSKSYRNNITTLLKKHGTRKQASTWA